MLIGAVHDCVGVGWAVVEARFVYSEVQEIKEGSRAGEEGFLRAFNGNLSQPQEKWNVYEENRSRS